MKNFLMILMLIVVCFHCGLAKIQRRMINGEKAEENEFPYLVSVRTSSITCGGALISDQYVLTAAHCLRRTFAGQAITVILGTQNYHLYENEPNRVIFNEEMDFWIHENFSLPLASNDIGLIRLPERVNFTESIKPIQLSRDERPDQKEVEAIAISAGWGKIKSKRYYPQSSILQKAKFRLLSIEDCFKYQNHFVEDITLKHICVFGLDSKPSHPVSPCDGDSGSPLVLATTGEMIGITSYVKDAKDREELPMSICDTTEAPIVHVRVSSYLDWISSKTGIPFD